MEQSLVDRYLKTVELPHEEKLAICQFYLWLLDNHMVKVASLLEMDEKLKEEGEDGSSTSI